MRSPRLTSYAAAVTLLLAAGPVSAGTITVALPDLLGAYEFTQFDFLSGLAPPAAVREMGFELPFAAADVEVARLVLVGSATTGSVRGDGFLAEDVEARAIGAFGAMLMVSDPAYVSGSVYDLYTNQTAALEGLFAADLPLGKVVNKAPPGAPAQARVKTILGIGVYDPACPPEIPDPDGGGGIPWYTGVNVVVPPRATITEAYLVLEGPGVPEPATLSLLAAGALMACRRRRSASVP